MSSLYSVTKEDILLPPITCPNLFAVPNGHILLNELSKMDDTLVEPDETESPIPSNGTLLNDESAAVKTDSDDEHRESKPIPPHESDNSSPSCNEETNKRVTSDTGFMSAMLSKSKTSAILLDDRNDNYMQSSNEDANQVDKHELNDDGMIPSSKQEMYSSNAEHQRCDSSSSLDSVSTDSSNSIPSVGTLKTSTTNANNGIHYKGESNGTSSKYKRMWFNEQELISGATEGLDICAGPPPPDSMSFLSTAHSSNPLSANGSIAMDVSNQNVGGVPYIMLESLPSSHAFAGRKVSLKQPVKIGRAVQRTKASHENAIFDCKVLSRNHALVWFENGKFYLQDTRSSNGTFVNNERLSAAGDESEPKEIFSEDSIQFGVDVVENTRKVTHGCVVATVRLFLPDGSEAPRRTALPGYGADSAKAGGHGSASGSAHGGHHGYSTGRISLSAQQFYELSQFVSDSAKREEVLEKKLRSLQELLDSTREASETGWHSMVEEDRLLSTIESLQSRLDNLLRAGAICAVKSTATAVGEKVASPPAQTKVSFGSTTSPTSSIASNITVKHISNTHGQPHVGSDSPQNRGSSADLMVSSLEDEHFAAATDERINKLREMITNLENEKERYEVTAKETLQKALDAKIEASSTARELQLTLDQIRQELDWSRDREAAQVADLAAAHERNDKLVHEAEDLVTKINEHEQKRAELECSSAAEIERLTKELDAARELEKKLRDEMEELVKRTMELVPVQSPTASESKISAVLLDHETIGTQTTDNVASIPIMSESATQSDPTHEAAPAASVRDLPSPSEAEATLSGELAAARDQLTAALLKVASLETELAASHEAASAEIERSTHELDELNTQLKSTLESEQSLRSDIESLKAERHSFNSQISELTSQMASLRESADRDASLSAAELARIANDVAIKNETIAQLESRVAELVTSLEDARQQQPQVNTSLPTESPNVMNASSNSHNSTTSANDRSSTNHDDNSLLDESARIPLVPPVEHAPRFDFEGEDQYLLYALGLVVLVLALLISSTPFCSVFVLE